MFVNQKSTEICYALLRVAAQIRRQQLKQNLEKLAFRFLEAATSEDFDLALKTSSSIDAMLKIGQSLYEIEPVNSKVISGELEAVNAAMRQSLGIDGLPNLDRIFEKANNAASYSAKTFADIRPSAGLPDSLPVSENNNGNSNGFSATIRQSAILDKIRQSGNNQAALKDIIAAFPEISERTMRYDLQKLCLQGLIERVGSGGPGSYYSVKNGA
ncbi:MAG: DeoR family transcriptional regulator [bacterium]|nr:DeoR family transcriptional regulator [bacterium]